MPRPHAAATRHGGDRVDAARLVTRGPCSAGRAPPSSNRRYVTAARRERARGRGAQHVARRALDRLQLALRRPRRGVGRSGGGRRVYGWRGRANRSLCGPRLDEHARVHHVHALAHAGDDAEVVRDQDRAPCCARPRASARAQGSVPGSSRRAPSSARLRSGASARTRAPSRSSPAGACRPRTDAGSPGAALSRSGIPTWSRSSAARVFARVRDMPKWVSSASRIWRPIVEHRIQARHRILEDHRDLLAAYPTQLGSERASRSRPRRSPCHRPTSRRGAGCRVTRETSRSCRSRTRRRCRASRRSAMSNEIPLTAWIVPRSVQNSTRRLSTESSGIRHGHEASGRAPREARRRSG